MGPKKSKKYKAAAKAARVDVASKEVSAKKKFMAMKKNRSKGKMPHNKPKKKKSAKVRRAARAAVGPKERKAKRVLKKAALKKAAAKKGESVNEYRRKLVIHHIEDKHEKKVARGIGAHEGKAEGTEKDCCQEEEGRQEDGQDEKMGPQECQAIHRWSQEAEEEEEEQACKEARQAETRRSRRCRREGAQGEARVWYHASKHLEAKERRRKAAPKKKVKK